MCPVVSHFWCFAVTRASSDDRPQILDINLQSTAVELVTVDYRLASDAHGRAHNAPRPYGGQKKETAEGRPPHLWEKKDAKRKPGVFWVIETHVPEFWP